MPLEVRIERSTPFFEEGVSIWNEPATGSSDGGDWCAAIDVSNDVVALTVGDIAGRGDVVVETMNAVRGSVLHALKFTRSPSDVLAAANAFVINRADDAMVTAIVAFYDRARRIITYANAGHPHPLVVVKESASFLVPLRADVPLGVYAHHCAQNYTIVLPPDALLVVYTDGVTERERDPVRGERDLADAAIDAYGVADGAYAYAIARQVFRTGRGHDDAAIVTLHTALAKLRFPRYAPGQESR